MPENLSFSQLLTNAFQAQLIDVHTAIPAKIVSYDEGKATVQILIKKKINGELILLPPITDVPVLQPRSNGGEAFISMPVIKGDTGMLVFQERSIDKWLVKGGEVDPKDGRKFDLSDAVFILGLYDHSKPLKYNEKNALEVKNKLASMILHPDGKIEFKGASEDLISIVASVIDNLISAKVVTALGLSPLAPDTIVKLTENKTQIATLKK